ncbi:hypothetical protein [Rheinheimera baltica]|uniref:hypothetical protein n=1 Tax=Rheinheimera baltica TaxID=67576 RepID=UPI0004837962|nr:hypothetical protein [Rheinheimera baltica]
MTIRIVNVDDNGVFINSSRPLLGMDSFVSLPLTPIEQFSGAKTYFYVFADEEQAKQLLNWTLETGYQPQFKEPKSVPQSITRRQARQQLLLMGLLDNVDPTIAVIPDQTARRMAEIYWQDATDFERDNPYLLSIAAALGLTPEQLDDAFIAAEAL